MSKYNPKRSLVVRVLIIAFTLTLTVTGIASAITIVIDGVKETAWSGIPGQTPGTITVPNEGTITDGYDIEEFLWTNDTTNMYFLLQTYADTIWAGTPMPTVYICLNTDNNTGTGGNYPNCNGMTGIDKYIRVQRRNPLGTALNVDVYNLGPNDGQPSLNLTVGVRVNNINEFYVSLADLGLATVGTCAGVHAAAIYFDNGIVDPDDTVPTAGTLDMTCGSPTAITLTDLTARTSTNVVAGSLAGILLLSVAFLLIRRSRKQTISEG
jgi:hypothetical protein